MIDDLFEDGDVFLASGEQGGDATP